MVCCSCCCVLCCCLQTVRFIHTTLQQAGYRAAMLHGQRSQAERNAALLEFKSGKAQVR